MEPNIEDKLSEYFPDLKGYKFNKVLGQGGQAVSLLLDHLEGQYVGKLFEFPPILASMVEEGKKIENESQILSELRHPNIPQVKEAIEGQDALLSIREYIPGQTLDQIISEKKFLTEEEALPVMNSVLNILDYLHNPEQHRHITEPVIHRDIKPQNIVINDKGVYLIDFGTSHFKNRTFTTMYPKGTFEFMAIEQFAGMAYPASDIYGLGATMINALLGRIPEEISSNKPYRIHYDNISKKFKKVLEKMVEPEISKRYSNIKEINDDIDRIRLSAKNNLVIPVSQLKSNVELDEARIDLWQNMLSCYEKGFQIVKEDIRKLSKASIISHNDAKEYARTENKLKKLFPKKYSGRKGYYEYKKRNGIITGATIILAYYGLRGVCNFTESESIITGMLAFIGGGMYSFWKVLHYDEGELINGGRGRAIKDADIIRYHVEKISRKNDKKFEKIAKDYLCTTDKLIKQLSAADRLGVEQSPTYNKNKNIEIALNKSRHNLKNNYSFIDTTLANREKHLRAIVTGIPEYDSSIKQGPIVEFYRCANS